MSTIATTDEPQSKREDALEQLYEIRDDLKTVANSDAEYATYAQNALDELEEAGYDV